MIISTKATINRTKDATGNINNASYTAHDAHNYPVATTLMLLQCDAGKTPVSREQRCCMEWIQLRCYKRQGMSYTAGKMMRAR